MQNYEARVLKSLNNRTTKCDFLPSKASESKLDTEEEFSDTKTLEAVEMLKKEHFDLNYSSSRTASILFKQNCFWYF